VELAELGVIEFRPEQLDARLLTIPGIGQSTAAVVVAEVGNIDRFDSDNALVSHAGLDPVVHQSGEK